MATNTTYVPNGYPLDTSKLQAAAQGVAGGCAANTTTNLDLDLTDDMVICFIEVLTTNISIGDYVVLNVVPTASPGSIVAAPIPGPWYLASNDRAQFHLETPMKIVAGLRLRAVIHTTVPLITPTVAVNYGLWKVLV